MKKFIVVITLLVACVGTALAPQIATAGPVDQDVYDDPIIYYSISRAYNPYSGEHFLATSGEVNTLVELGWQDDGFMFWAPNQGDQPIYRLFNPYSSEHIYTTDANEHASLETIGWIDEGTIGYATDKSDIPVYRMYNPWADTCYSHLFTTDINERDTLKGLGWEDEGIAWYGLATNPWLSPMSSYDY